MFIVPGPLSPTQDIFTSSRGNVYEGDWSDVKNETWEREISMVRCWWV
jgi:hypothetical protein